MLVKREKKFEKIYGEKKQKEFLYLALKDGWLSPYHIGKILGLPTRTVKRWFVRLKIDERRAERIYKHGRVSKHER